MVQKKSMASFLKGTCDTPLMRFFHSFLCWLSLISLCFIGVNRLVSVQAFLNEMLARVAGHVYGIWGAGWTVAENILIHLGTGRFITVEGSCSGLGMCAVLWAIMFAMPVGWPFRVLASFCGIALIQCWNILRIAHLFHLAVNRPDLFEFFHLHAWQAGNLMLMLLAITVMAALSNRETGFSQWLKGTIRPRATVTLFLSVFLPVVISTATAYAWGPGGGSGGSGGSGGAVPFISWWQLLPLAVYICVLFKTFLTRDE